MQYGFRTKAGDEKINNVLLSLQGKERTDFIRNALNFYIDNKDRAMNLERDIAEIKQTLSEISSMLKNGNINVTDKNTKEPENNNNNDVLKDLLNDFLSL